MAAVSFNANNRIQNLHDNPTNSNLFDRIGQFAKKIFNGIKDYIEKVAIVLVRMPIINKLASRIPSEFLTNNLNFQIHTKNYSFVRFS